MKTCKTKGEKVVRFVLRLWGLVVLKEHLFLILILLFKEIGRKMREEMRGKISTQLWKLGKILAALSASTVSAISMP